MQTCEHWWVESAKKKIFIKKCPQFSQKLSATNACMIATFFISEQASLGWIGVKGALYAPLSNKERRSEQQQQHTQKRLPKKSIAKPWT